MPKYSIDTSALLEGWVRQYPPDVFETVWARMDALINTGSLRATEEVLQELSKKDDSLHGWAKARQGLFVPIDEDIQLHVSTILAAHARLVDTRKNRSAADPFVIGLARIHGCAVVTAEPPTGRPDRPNIPDVCDAMGIARLSLLEMFRAEGWKL